MTAESPTTEPIHDRLHAFVDSVTDTPEGRFMVVAGLLFETASRAPELVGEVIDRALTIAEKELEAERGGA